MTIQEKCNKLNVEIHDRLFYNNYLLKASGKNNYERVFTSLDLIEDCQNAIEEFESLPEENIQSRSTLYIYGVLQSIYCQQDGLFHLYKTITQEEIKNVYGLFEKYNFNTEIREIRNDIAGHSTNRKGGTEFYFIAKGPNSKYKFSYAGYVPQFRLLNVDLRKFIDEQKGLTQKILTDVEDYISNAIQLHKDKFKIIKLVNLLGDVNRPTQLINRGIHDSDRNFQAEIGIEEISNNLSELKTELNKRYNNQIPEALREVFRLQNYILKKIQDLFSKKELLNNPDAEIFMDSFKNQMNELIEILKEIDEEFSQ